MNGDGEIRTLDPLLARQVLSQLSYTPTDAGLPFFKAIPIFYLMDICPVGLSGLEPPTSRLSGVRSNQLSYNPLHTVLYSASLLVLFFINLAATYFPIPSPA